MASEAVPGPEEPLSAAQAGTPPQSKVFWGALLGAVVVLPGLIVELVGKAEGA